MSKQARVAVAPIPMYLLAAIPMLAGMIRWMYLWTIEVAWARPSVADAWLCIGAAVGIIYFTWAWIERGK